MLKFIIILAAVAVCYGQSNMRVTYTLFKKHNQFNGQSMSQSGSIPGIFNSTQKTIFLIHGYAGNTVSRFNQLVRDSIFDYRNSDDYNAIVVDWTLEASFSYAQASNNVHGVARNLASFIEWLTTKGPTTLTITTTEEPTTITTTEEPTTTTTTEEPTTTTTTEEPTTTTTTEEPTTTTTTEEPTTTTTTEEPTTTKTTEEPTTTTTTEESTTTTTTEELTTTTTTEESTTTTTTEEPTTTTTSEATTTLPAIADVEDFHLVGFGLGAHVAGIGGRILRANSKVVGRITGLDPSGRNWGAGSERLRRGDAKYVEVIHTDTSGIFANGIGDPIGDINFYANGGSNQPGCFSHSCNHDRAFELFAASLINPHLRGQACTSEKQMNLNLCRGSHLNIGGVELSKIGSAIYRINTSRKFPFY